MESQGTKRGESARITTHLMFPHKAFFTPEGRMSSKSGQLWTVLRRESTRVGHAGIEAEAGVNVVVDDEADHLHVILLQRDRRPLAELAIDRLAHRRKDRHGLEGVRPVADAGGAVTEGQAFAVGDTRGAAWPFPAVQRLALVL
jgi:hypothetical protein